MSQPAYLRLYEKLKNEILSGAYKYGARFPSKRDLAEENGLSLVTVEHALEILCDEGWLTSRERSGFFVAFRESGNPAQRPADYLEFAEAPPAKDHAVNGLPFPAYARAVRGVLSQYGSRVMEKSPNTGCPELREALAEYLAAERGMWVSPSQIIIGSGAEYLYGILVTLLGIDSVFALEDPSYSVIRQVYESYGVKCRMLPLERDGIRSEALWNTDARILHVTPFNSWPSGVTASATKRREYLSWAVQKDGYLIEDDFDSELSASSKTEDTLFSLNPEKVIHLNTFTRTVSPALRAGYMVLPSGLLQTYTERAGFLSCSVPVTEQLTLAHLLTSGEFVRHIRRVRRSRRKNPTRK